MLTKLKVKKLNGKFDFDLSFNKDLNILTGKNGSGKTTLLKLIWYLLSRNFNKKTYSEIFFDSVLINTEKEKLEIRFNKKIEFLSFISEINKKKNIQIDNKKQNDTATKLLLESFSYYYDNYDNGDDYQFEDKTLFFPTFRRIEGGFLIEDEGTSEYQSIFKKFGSYYLSKGSKHRFITSVSSKDIVDLLTKKYAEVSEEILKIEKEQSNFILKIIDSNKEDKNILEEIKNKQHQTNNKKDILLKPFTVLSKLITEIFKDKGIRITETLTFGESANAIISEKLSAGEKQMLSFISYCIFTENSIIFIDEPELSLHPDWQRLLVPTLLELSSTNQFFIATHSPFIYSKYPDKEIILDKDKGGE